MYKNFIPSLLLIVSSLITSHSLAEEGKVAAQASNPAKIANQVKSLKSSGTVTTTVTTVTTTVKSTKSSEKVAAKPLSKKSSKKVAAKVRGKKSSAKVRGKKSSAKVATQLQSNESSANVANQLPSFESSNKITAPSPIIESPTVEAAPAMVVTPPPSYASPAKIVTQAQTSDPLLLDARGLWQNPKTKLIWSRCSVGQEWTGRECTGISVRLSWKQAHEAAKSYAFDGKQDWRLPTYKELLSLRLLNAGDPEAEDSPWFYKPDATDGYGWYWSSKPYGYLFSTYAWAVDLDIGKAEFIDQKRSARLLLVREPK